MNLKNKALIFFFSLIIIYGVFLLLYLVVMNVMQDHFHDWINYLLIIISCFISLFIVKYQVEHDVPNVLIKEGFLIYNKEKIRLNNIFFTTANHLVNTGDLEVEELLNTITADEVFEADKSLREKFHGTKEEMAKYFGTKPQHIRFDIDFNIGYVKENNNIPVYILRKPEDISVQGYRKEPRGNYIKYEKE